MKTKIAHFLLLVLTTFHLCASVTTEDHLTTKEYQLKFSYMIELDPVGHVSGVEEKNQERPETWSHLSDRDIKTICWLEKQGIEFEGVEGAWLIHHNAPETTEEIKAMLPYYGKIEVHNTEENHQKIYEWIQGKEGHPVVPAAPMPYEDISLPLFAGLEPDELEAVFSDWREKMNGKQIHRITKFHGYFEWQLAIEHSPKWNKEQRSWSIQTTVVDMPEGKYVGLTTDHKKVDNKLTSRTTNYLYFGKSYRSKRVAIRGTATRDDYEILLEKLNREGVIEFQHGEKVTGRYLSQMIDLIQKDNGKLYVGFEAPFNQNSLVCDIYSEKFSYSAMFLDIH